MTRRLAAAVAILCLQAAAQEPAPCAISGIVKDSASNKPVVRARVLAEVLGSYSFVRSTNEQGNFCFERVSPAEYRVIVQKAGYLDARVGVTLAVEKDTVVKPLELTMTRYGGVAGTVLDAAGEPEPGAGVTIWERAKDNSNGGPEQVDSTDADGNGSFHVSHLAPGTYFVSVRPVSKVQRPYAFPLFDNRGQLTREKEVETFYSASFTFADANPVEVKAGQQIDNLVLTLKKAHLRTVTGRIADPPVGGFLSFNGETETASNYGAIPIGTDGSFARVDLLPAKYTLRLSDEHGLMAQKEVDLTSGDAVGITLDPIETMNIPVSFRTEGRGPAFHPGPAGMGNVWLAREGSDDGVLLQSSDDGTYRFPGVQKGIYKLHVGLAGQSLYLKGLTYGGETQTGGKVDLRSVRQGGLEAVFSPNVANVQGQVEVPGDESDLTVILVDETGKGESRIVDQARTDQKGRFHMAGVAPGKYRLFAIEAFDEDRWGSPELAKWLAGKSLELELKESEKKRVVVALIRAEEWQAAIISGPHNLSPK